MASNSLSNAPILALGAQNCYTKFVSCKGYRAPIAAQCVCVCVNTCFQGLYLVSLPWIPLEGWVLLVVSGLTTKNQTKTKTARIKKEAGGCRGFPWSASSEDTVDFL